MISTNEGKNMMERAADIDGTSGSEKKKKKPKKKKAKATSVSFIFNDLVKERMWKNERN